MHLCHCMPSSVLVPSWLLYEFDHACLDTCVTRWLLEACQVSHGVNCMLHQGNELFGALSHSVRAGHGSISFREPGLYSILGAGWPAVLRL